MLTCKLTVFISHKSHTFPRSLDCRTEGSYTLHIKGIKHIKKVTALTDEAEIALSKTDCGKSGVSLTFYLNLSSPVCTCCFVVPQTDVSIRVSNILSVVQQEKFLLALFSFSTKLLDEYLAQLP